MADRRRALIEALKGIPSKHRAWLSEPVGIRGFELFCYHGWGVVPNDAQLESMQDILEWPPGSIHLWRFGNRVGKTSGLMLDHSYIAWQKWRYENLDHDGWLAYRYKTLHAAPQGILMGKAWEIIEVMIEGGSIMQRDPIRLRQRPGIFIKSPLFKAGVLRSRDGTDNLVVTCANGSQIDFLQTHNGAGRMESDAWWFIDWDEFGEHQPVGNVPYLFSSTFLPRSSDFMAPVVLSSTEKEHNAGVYMELEDLAERNPRDWNLKEFGRSVNFSQSQASMDRQIRLSTDIATAQRSVFGGTADGSSGSLLPAFTLRRAFDPTLPARRTIDDLPPLPDGRSWRLVQTFDHAVKGDRNVVLTVAVPWPVRGREDLIAFPAQVIDIDELRGSRVLTPDEMVGFALNAYNHHGKRSIWFTDATGEAGIMIHRMLRQKGVPSRDFNFTARVSKTDRRTKKGYGRTGLQRLFSLGLPIDDRGVILLPPGTDIDALEFGGIRIPLPPPDTGQVIRRLWRQLAMLRADDEKLVQDHAMTALMVAAFLYPYMDRASSPSTSSGNPFGTRADRYRGLASVR